MDRKRRTTPSTGPFEQVSRRFQRLWIIAKWQHRRRGRTFVLSLPTFPAYLRWVRVHWPSHACTIVPSSWWDRKSPRHLWKFETRCDVHHDRAVVRMMRYSPQPRSIPWRALSPSVRTVARTLMRCRPKLSDVTILPHFGQRELGGKLGPVGRRCWNIPSMLAHNSINLGNVIDSFHWERNISIISGNQTRLPSPAGNLSNPPWPIYT